MMVEAYTIIVVSAIKEIIRDDEVNEGNLVEDDVNAIHYGANEEATNRVHHLSIVVGIVEVVGIKVVIEMAMGTLAKELVCTN